MKTTICFVKRNPQIREYKEALALKRTGKYRLILIAQRYDYGLFKDVFDKIVDYGMVFNRVPDFGFTFLGRKVTPRRLLLFATERWNTEDAARRRLAQIVRKTEADIFHAHAEPNIIPRLVMENTGKPVVFDAYDFSGISQGIENLTEEERLAEKYCLEHAAGICHKGPELEIDFYRQHGYKINCPELQWMDYCDESLFADMNTRKLSEEDGEIHLVYTGAISTDPQEFSFNYYIPLGKQLAEQKIHLHLYPNPYQYSTAPEYMELARQEKYFHFHQPLGYRELSHEIARYDYGLWVHPGYELLDVKHNGAKSKVAIGNKLFSYLEAGLPIIVSDHLSFGKEIVEKHGIGFAVRDESLPDLGGILQRTDYGKIRVNVGAARKELSLNTKAAELEEFYGKLRQ